MGVPAWADPALLVSTDQRLTARLRLQQSWYRSEVLGVEPGLGGQGNRRLVGNMLSYEAVESDPALNFFRDPIIAGYVERRVGEHRRGGRGLISDDRLRRNLLSSQPMAFTLAAVLNGADDRAAILSAVSGLPIAAVEWVEAEWGPDKAEHLGDNTAADLAFGATLTSGASLVVVVETKYSEPLDQGLAQRPERYDTAIAESAWCGAGFRDVMNTRGHNQICRDLLLGASLESAGTFDRALAIVVTMAEDKPTIDSIGRVRAVMSRPDRLRHLSWQQVIDVLGGSSLAAFAEVFEERYVPREWQW